jgi:hypothetical protein
LPQGWQIFFVLAIIQMVSRDSFDKVGRPENCSPYGFSKWTVIVSVLQFFDKFAVSDPSLGSRLSKIAQNEFGLEPIGGGL